ncbi:hypothetical protein GCM10007301_51760 [Azorhizobium oxalatiphilum]|uniref:Plasmid stabilization system protein ParE n=1 Tax=Azorhizobium oxalatiphilum TaxID=980631 RepID=A0A917CDK2_9HYPH|nr:type II toxin-antitoxin system RelE/ParE family toxin [Azorhizobium oxalatiphilum]GGF85520.1 hypothetical protein GCM10007301_51760 [Azorhizobium oxalatiphilum]
MKVRLSPRARAYLLEEAAYLRRHSRAAAEAFLGRMRSAQQLLATYPASGEALPMAGVRRLVSGDYVLDYQVRDEALDVLSVRHGRQQPAGLPIAPDFDYEASPDVAPKTEVAPAGPEADPEPDADA